MDHFPRNNNLGYLACDSDSRWRIDRADTRTMGWKAECTSLGWKGRNKLDEDLGNCTSQRNF